MRRIFVHDGTKVVEVNKVERNRLGGLHFEPFYDETFGKVIKSRMEYNRLMSKHGFIDTRDYKFQNQQVAEKVERGRWNVKRYGQSSPAQKGR